MTCFLIFGTRPFEIRSVGQKTGEINILGLLWFIRQDNGGTLCDDLRRIDR